MEQGRFEDLTKGQESPPPHTPHNEELREKNADYKIHERGMSADIPEVRSDTASEPGFGERYEVKKTKSHFNMSPETAVAEELAELRGIEDEMRSIELKIHEYGARPWWEKILRFREARDLQHKWEDRVHDKKIRSDKLRESGHSFH